MKRRSIDWTLLAATCVAAVLCTEAVAQADTNPVVLYNGYVTNTRNEPVTGAFALTFKLFDAATGGNEVWSENQNATIDAGNLATALGGVTHFTPGLFNKQLYLAVKIGQEELPGRQAIGWVPLAMQADNASGIAGLPVVSTGCSAGQALTFSQTGWTCASAGANYTAGPGVQLAGTVISLPTGCTTGQLLKWNGTTWVCAADDNAAFTAGGGLQLVGNNFSLLGSCNAGQLLKYNGTTWACAADDNTGKTYLAGDGLSLDAGSGTFSLLGTCSDGQILKRQSGAWACGSDADHSFGAASGGGLSLTGNNFGLISCAAGQVLKYNGSTWACAADDNSGKTYAAAASRGLALSGTGNTDFGLISCATGQVLKYNNSAWACADDIVGTPGSTYTAGNGLAITGTQFSVMPCPLPDEYLRWSGTSWSCVSNWQGDIISPAYGGLGVDLSSATTGALLYKGPTGWTLLAPGANGTVLKLAGGVPAWSTSTAGTITSITAGAGLTGGVITAAGTLAVDFGVSGSSTQAARADHTHDAAGIASGTLPLARGGTGQSTAASPGGIVYGQSTSALAVTAAGTAGQVLKSAGSGTPTWASLTTADVSGTLAVTQGGTGATTASAARTALGAAGSGANSDITSLTNLTSMASITGSTTPGSSAIYAAHSATTGARIAIYGQVSSGDTFSFAINGYAGPPGSAGSASAVYGLNDQTTGKGVWGSAAGTSGVNYGVYGSTSSSGGYGLYTPNNAKVDGTLTVGTNITLNGATGNVAASSFTGNASTASALAANPTNCTGGVAAGIAADGTAEGCVATTSANQANALVLRDSAGGLSAGTITAAGYSFSVAQTRTMVISAAAFMADLGAHATMSGTPLRRSLVATTGTTPVIPTLHAPLNLPVGATVRGVRCWINDSNTSLDAKVDLFYTDYGSGGSDAAILVGSATSGSSGWQEAIGTIFYTVPAGRAHALRFYPTSNTPSACAQSTICNGVPGCCNLSIASCQVTYDVSAAG